MDELAAAGVDRPVVPGIMPIGNYRQVQRMAELSGTKLPVGLARRLHAAADDPDEVGKIGVEHATELCDALLAAGAPGLHFYTMNRADLVLRVCANLGWRAVPAGSPTTSPEPPPSAAPREARARSA